MLGGSTIQGDSYENGISKSSLMEKYYQGQGSTILCPIISQITENLFLNQSEWSFLNTFYRNHWKISYFYDIHTFCDSEGLFYSIRICIVSG